MQSALLFAQPCTTNFLNNPSFESPVQPAPGNNFPAPYNVFGGWSIPSATAGTADGGFNIVKVNGTGYSGGPDIAHGPGNQYVDINNAGGYVEQNFTLSCPATITFSGWFSRREPGVSGFSSYIDINSGATVVATSTVVNFTNNESEETWKQVTGTASLAAGTYTFRFFMDNFTNIDDAFLCASPGCVLPITIADFSAVSQKCTDKLSWITSSEINSSRFDVEQSVDGNSFKTVGSIQSKKISTGSRYSFNYNTNGTAQSFYRLKAIDVDEKITYSKIVDVASNCNTISLNVYPNPVADVLHINVSNNSSSNLLVFNTEGKTVIPFTILQNGDNVVNIKNLSKGVYIVKVLGQTETKVFRITKL
jgi:hypothetical protein